MPRLWTDIHGLVEQLDERGASSTLLIACGPETGLDQGYSTTRCPQKATKACASAPARGSAEAVIGESAPKSGLWHVRPPAAPDSGPRAGARQKRPGGGCRHQRHSSWPRIKSSRSGSAKLRAVAVGSAYAQRHQVTCLQRHRLQSGTRAGRGGCPDWLTIQNRKNSSTAKPSKVSCACVSPRCAASAPQTRLFLHHSCSVTKAIADPGWWWFHASVEDKDAVLQQLGLTGLAVLTLRLNIQPR